MIKQDSTDDYKRYSRYYTYIPPLFRSPIAKTYGTYTLTILVVAVFIFFAIKPTVETIIVLQKKLQDSQDVLTKINQKSQNLSLGKNNYEMIDLTTKQKVNLAVPVNIQLKTLISSLEQAANSNQASISALQIQPVTLENKTTPGTKFTLATVDFTYNLEGSYATLINILKQLQSSPRIISIDNLIFNKAIDSSTLLMSVTGKAYYLK